VSRLAGLVRPRTEAFAFLGLGSNEGDRLGYLQAAVDLLEAERRIRVDAVSSVYETDPVGGPEQEPYLNLGLRVATRLSPRGLLRRCQAVEQTLGRVRTVRWGPRTIDIDILLYGTRTVAIPRLEIPHPRLAERPFALIPTIEVGPGMTWPDGTSLTATLARLAPIDGVHQVGTQVRHPAEPRP
jgi:2-amino-4-hydroxy-6-hydroxymethyldihydropteridine diphosphokinase